MNARAIWVALTLAAGIGVAVAACVGDLPAGSSGDAGTSDAIAGGDSASGDGASGDCPTDQTSCGGSCFDLKSSATNCGKCGRNCYGGTCSGAACSAYIVAKQPTTGTVAKLATDGTRVLWADTGIVAIEQIAASGGTPITLAAANVNGSTADVLALGNGTVVYAYLNGGIDAPGVGVARVDQPDSGIEVESVTNAVTAVGISKSGSHLFYIEKPGTNANLFDCPLPVDAGACKSPASGHFGEEIAADDTYLFYNLSGASGPQTGLYLDRFGSAFDGSNPLIFTTKNTNTVAVDGTWAYWTESPDAGTQFVIHRTLESGPGATQTPVAHVASLEFATDGTNIYYWDGTSIISQPVAGGANTTLAPAAAFTQIAVGGGLLVWTDGATIHGIELP